MKLPALGPAIVALAVLAACGGTPTTGNPGSGRPAAEATSAGEANSGEAPAIPYTDTRFHYRVDAPGRMTANSDGTASVIGPSERLVVAILQGGKASDLNSLAREDIAALPSTTASFKLRSGPSQVALGAYKAEKFVYSYNAGTSQVTGRPLDLVGVRYYIPKDSTTVAVVTYGIVSNQYDPQGADDIAGTFRWQ